MNSAPCCPICRADDWQDLGSRQYHANDMDNLSEYEKRRFRVLFEIWFPNKTQVTLTNSICRECGFVSNLPRPEESDVGKKYEFLSSLGQDYSFYENDEMARKRSIRTFKECSKWLDERSRILDYGGADGRIMAEFSERGHNCYLVDYNESPKPYVTKLGDTLDEIDEVDPFDLIVCNHVIEHVAEPVEVLSNLGKMLKNTGRIYVEVPMEIWRKPPLKSEPVTHINFFVAGSLRRCLEEAGFSVKSIIQGTYLHQSGRVLPAVRGVADRDGGNGTCQASGYDSVVQFISPDIATRVRRAWDLRERFPAIATHKFKKLFNLSNR